MWRIRDVYPGSRILIFTHPGSRIQKQQWKTLVNKICCHTFFWSHKFHKIVLFYFWNVKEKNLGQFSKNYRTFYLKNCQKAPKNMVLGSGIRKKPIPDPGSRIQGSKSTQSRIPDPDPQHWSWVRSQHPWHSETWGAADEAVLNIVREKIKKSPKKIFLKKIR